MKCSIKIIGYIVLAFGAGIVLTYFLPTGVLVVTEAVIIVAAGLLWLFNK